MRIIHSLVGISALLLVCPVLHGCGDDDPLPVDPTPPEPTPPEPKPPEPRPPEDLEARRVEVVATDGRFNPSLIVADPGEPLVVSLRNDGALPHSILFELPGQEVRLVGELAPGESGELELTVPREQAEFVFYCPVDDHRDLGMEGILSAQRSPVVNLEEVGNGFTSPVGMVAPPDGSGRRFVLDQTGLIRILEASVPGVPAEKQTKAPFLDLRDSLVELRENFDERGLLGMAFHPEFAQNGRFFVYYSAPLREGAPEGWDHTSRIVELRVSDDPDLADRASERVILEVDQPQFNHNGGTIAFGPQDGLLYIALGDGGGGGDIDEGHTPDIGNGQDRTNLLGSILRIDVDVAGDAAQPYGIPEDNPFVGAEGANEIYAYGLRNPWRMSFDREQPGDLYVADAGQALYEEVNLIQPGENYGWNILEGTHCFNPDAFEEPLRTCSRQGPFGETLQWPIIEFGHANLEGGFGTVVVGGYVYRGERVPALQGQYLFGVFERLRDEPRSAIYTAVDRRDQDEVWPVQRIHVEGSAPRGEIGHFLLGFGQDEEGEVYVLTTDSRGPSGATGRVYQLAPPGIPLPGAAPPQN